MRLLLTLTFFFTAYCAYAASEGEYAAKNYGGLENFEIVKNATHVTGCTLTPDGEPNRPETWKHLDDPSSYHPGKAGEVPSKLANEFRKNLLNPVLDNPRYYGKGCMPIYHVRLNFRSKDHGIDLDLCFYCDLFSVSRDGKQVGGGSFDEFDADLLALCRKTFPDDPALPWIQKNRSQPFHPLHPPSLPSQNSQK